MAHAVSKPVHVTILCNVQGTLVRWELYHRVIYLLTTLHIFVLLSFVLLYTCSIQLLMIEINTQNWNHYITVLSHTYPFWGDKLDYELQLINRYLKVQISLPVTFDKNQY